MQEMKDQISQERVSGLESLNIFGSKPLVDPFTVSFQNLDRNCSSNFQILSMDQHDPIIPPSFNQLEQKMLSPTEKEMQHRRFEKEEYEKKSRVTVNFNSPFQFSSEQQFSDHNWLISSPQWYPYPKMPPSMSINSNPIPVVQMSGQNSSFVSPI